MLRPKRELPLARGLALNLLYRWRRLMTEGGTLAIVSDVRVTGNQDVPMIRGLIAKRPTYGYRGMTAILNHLLRNEVHNHVNHKRAYRIIHVHQMPLVRRYGAFGCPMMARTSSCAQIYVGAVMVSRSAAGMAEAYVKTFKRDYVHINSLPNVEIVLKLIAEWFEDYNENHPLSRLKCVRRAISDQLKPQTPKFLVK